MCPRADKLQLMHTASWPSRTFIVCCDGHIRRGWERSSFSEAARHKWCGSPCWWMWTHRTRLCRHTRGFCEGPEMNSSQRLGDRVCKPKNMEIDRESDIETHRRHNNSEAQARQNHEVDSERVAQQGRRRCDDPLPGTRGVQFLPLAQRGYVESVNFSQVTQQL